ncbi:MAG: hypothetical protein F6J97_00925 [Leptolyngbya sp. SIO4C1]|nr:hypothetical protein [Leptolyngbya sp. SIO4C1]
MRVCEPVELAYLREQADREQQQDQQAEEWGFAVLELAELVKRWGKAAIARELAALPDTSPVIDYAPTCEQCVNWRPQRAAALANGTTAQLGDFCEARAAADLEQLPKDYAERCSLYEEKIPF